MCKFLKNMINVFQSVCILFTQYCRNDEWFSCHFFDFLILLWLILKFNKFSVWRHLLVLLATSQYRIVFAKRLKADHFRSLSPNHIYHKKMQNVQFARKSRHIGLLLPVSKVFTMDNRDSRRQTWVPLKIPLSKFSRVRAVIQDPDMDWEGNVGLNSTFKVFTSENSDSMSLCLVLKIH